MSERKLLKKQIDDRRFKMSLITTFYILLFTIAVSGLLTQKVRVLFLVEGIFLVVYSMLGVIFKIPLFNRHYILNSYGFDDRFGLRHYFAFSIMIFIGLILFFISFGM